MSRPSEIDSLLEAQADTGVCAPARAPSRRLTLAADALAISIGIASGLTRRAPFSFWTSQLDSSVIIPPMPVATATPSRSRSTGLSSRSPYPASCQASIAATTASCAHRSSRRASTRSKISAGSTAACAAIFTGRSSAQSASILDTPDFPASKVFPRAGDVAPERGGGSEPGDDDADA